MALNWSFKARLHNASDAMKNRYFMLLEELATYKGVKTSESWDKVRVYIGRQTYGAMTFRGKTLCLAIALNPADYAETKYVFDDISEVARFASTPMLVRLSSDRQVKYLRELLETLFDGVNRVEAEKISNREIPFYEKEQLVEMALIKVYAGKKKAAAEDEDEEEPAPAPVKVAEPKPKSEPEKKVAATKAVVTSYEIPKSVKSNPKGIINLGAINNNFDGGATVTPQALKDKGLLGEHVSCLKVLAGGNLDKPLTIAACAFSREAKEAITAAGGKIIVIPTK